MARDYKFPERLRDLADKMIAEANAVCAAHLGGGDMTDIPDSTREAMRRESFGGDREAEAFHDRELRDLATATRALRCSSPGVGNPASCAGVLAAIRAVEQKLQQLGR